MIPLLVMENANIDCFLNLTLNLAPKQGRNRQSSMEAGLLGEGVVLVPTLRPCRSAELD